jgi:hypothetical protein
MARLRLFMLSLPLAVALASCGGKETFVTAGSCSLTGSAWSCLSDHITVPANLPACPPGVASGGSCPDDVDTTNPTMPSHTTTSCFDCGGDGLGVYWTCPGQSLEDAGVFNCSQ